MLVLLFSVPKLLDFEDGFDEDGLVATKQFARGLTPLGKRALQSTQTARSNSIDVVCLPGETFLGRLEKPSPSHVLLGVAVGFKLALVSLDEPVTHSTR